MTFQDGQQLFNSFRAGHQKAFWLELLQMPPHLIVQQEYPLLTGQEASLGQSLKARCSEPEKPEVHTFKALPIGF